MNRIEKVIFGISLVGIVGIFTMAHRHDAQRREALMRQVPQGSEVVGKGFQRGYSEFVIYRNGGKMFRVSTHKGTQAL